MGRHLFTFILLFLSFGLAAQQNAADSLRQLLNNTKNDTARVDLMCDIGYELRVNEPEKALKITSEAFSLAKKIKYINGQSRSLGTLAIIFRLIGNFPLALEYNLKRLELVEKTTDQKKYAGVLINTGFVYVNLEEYNKALEYYYKADSVIKQLDSAAEVKFTIALNMGDVYDKLNINDSAFSYFTRSLSLARQVKSSNTEYEAMAMVGLGNTYLKTQQYPLAMANYKSGIDKLKKAGNDDLLCEATLGLATLFKKTYAK